MESKRYNVRNITKECMEDDEFWKSCKEKYNHFTNMRSLVIDYAIDIENLLSTVILHFTVGTDYSRHRIFREFIFDAEFCTFMQKRKMLSMIFDLFPNLTAVMPSEEGKDLRRRLNKFILDRDMFVHGAIFIDAVDNNVVIEYYRGGMQEEEINDELISEIEKNAHVIEERLLMLNEYFRKNRLE